MTGLRRALSSAWMIVSDLKNHVVIQNVIADSERKSNELMTGWIGLPSRVNTS
jgi:hypothetical protein